MHTGNITTSPGIIIPDDKHRIENITGPEGRWVIISCRDAKTLPPVFNYDEPEDKPITGLIETTCPFCNGRVRLERR